MEKLGNNITKKIVRCLLISLVLTLSCRGDSGLIVGTSEVSNHSSSVNETEESSPSHEYRLLNLEGHVNKILEELQRLKEEKGNLSRRVNFLEMCDCQPKRCLHEGSTWVHGDTWSKGPCHICRCHSGEVTCFVPNTPQCRQPKDCWCQHGGLCVEEGNARRCICPYGCAGTRCQYLPTNPCVFLPDAGNCTRLGFDENLTGSVLRYHYDWHSQTCKSFPYSGCGGSANNFLSRRKCENVCLKGACCIRRLYPENEKYQPAKECKDIDLQSCRRLVKSYDNSSPLEVVSFRPGSSCDNSGCAVPGKCHDGLDTYSLGEKHMQGCEQCRCEEIGKIVCGCSTKGRRKELRDLTTQDRYHFQEAIAALRQPPAEGAPSTWERLRDLYSRHIMHATHPKYFLLWHRTFLRLVERKLQEENCDVNLPYYDFTTDAGAFETAHLWQGNFFAGQGRSNNEYCVKGHPFGNSTTWKPCILRRFNHSIQIPSVLEIAQILNTDDFIEFSKRIKTVAAYVHTFIGGTMMTGSCFYDPVFLPVYTFIDSLFQKWLENHPLTQTILGGDQYLEPFGVTSYSEEVCVEYIEPTSGKPCVEVEQEVPSWEDGYGPDGYDSIGYDRDGYNRAGFNRDGYDAEGYDHEGYDRYGFNRQGYSGEGFDSLGNYENGTSENTNIFNKDHLDCFCRNREGFDESGYDRYGYNKLGLDRRGCGFGYNGPFAPKLIHDLWHWLSIQQPIVISSLGRYCPSLNPVDEAWWRQCWGNPSSNIADFTPSIPQSPLLPTNRLCIKMEAIYSTSCPCPSGHVTCAANPCTGAVCASIADATCFIDTCGSCNAMWIKNKRMINCQNNVQTTEYCDPNPCLHGGLCMPSRWPQRPSDVTCQCPNHFEGRRCERPATQVCLQNYPGRCSRRETRWYFDLVTKTCRQLEYGGCGGSPNNFPTRYHCEQKCVMGACCYRRQRKAGLYGYDTNGFDRYGFNELGLSSDGIKRDVLNGLAGGKNVYDRSGYDFRGYDKEGFDQTGFDQYGYDRSGFGREGFNATGFNKIGDYDGDISYNKRGYDQKGYNRAGVDCQGSKATGLNRKGAINGYDFSCEYTTREECYSITSDSKSSSHVSFNPGVRCEHAKCNKNCGCSYGLKAYKHKDIIKIGCDIVGVCNKFNKIDTTCKALRLRKEIRDLNSSEWRRLHSAIRSVAAGFPSKWAEYTAMYSSHSNTLEEGALLLPWLRYYIHQVESELQAFDCGVTIPYFDWTVDAGDMISSLAWQANAFGGNGMEPDACVKRHLFQDPFQGGWEPCLQRNFSTLSPLPHTLHIHRMLRAPTFLSFHNQLRNMSALFKQWVGGHVSTDHAPYDPLFLSHAAFLDKLWTDWQQRHPNGVSTFPANERFVPMSPFQVSPDDVFNSEKLLCVKYVKLSKGTPCKLPAVPEEPKLTEFDLEGYDAFGYDESGFDAQGFDRHGFKLDTFNRDGYDIHGFNKFGYDRFGFDIHGYTKFGFHRNGTHRNEANEVDIRPGYDIAGYDAYGFNKFGFDRQGRDIYGMDASGNDFNGCNFYRKGPFYVLQKVALDDILETLDLKELEALPVFCQNVNGLFSFPLIPDNTFDEVHGGILLPEHTVAKRFCTVFPLHNGCGFGHYETQCLTDRCKERICWGKEGVGCWTQGCSGTCQPYWYNITSGAPMTCSACRANDGSIHENGSIWNPDPCTVCSCDSGNLVCDVAVCPDVTCSSPIRLPHECCATCNACVLGKNVYADGSAVPTKEESCQKCLCRYGNIVCEPVTCVPVPDECENVTTSGECCPTCGDCDSTDESTWRDAQCRLCKCQDGMITCERTSCPLTGCTHPSPPRPPQQCCPRCHECFHEGRLLRHGHEFRPDPCRVCQCNHGNVTCDVEDCPPVTCHDPLHVPGQCCPQCTSDCHYEGEIHPDGQTFHPRYNPCLECRCEASRVRCSPVQCPPVQLPCQHPLPMSGECCPAKCPECEYKGSLHEHGEEWTVDHCEMCVCNEGVVSCQLTQTCPPTNCSHGAAPPGKCCPICSDCLYEGERKSDGSLFTSGYGEKCHECACVGGEVMCHKIGRCPAISCDNPIKETGRCCAVCRGCVINGESYEDGDNVPSNQLCQECRCVNGETLCDAVSCQQLECENPVRSPGECCPTCPTTCTKQGRVYVQGDKVPHRDPCTLCVCEFGTVRCRRETCPHADCELPKTLPGGCCPVCDSIPVCKYGGRVYKDGESLHIAGRECQECRCRSGKIDCRYIECPEAHCLYPVQEGCCPSCSGCSFNGQTYRNTQNFPDPRGLPCAECTCSHGNVTCDHVSCQDVTCTHPVIIPGKCCPECSDCSYEGQTYRTGETFTERTDPCISCRCHYGSVTCNRRRCPPLRCHNVQPPAPGQCCPTCDDEQGLCEYNGQRYSEGDVIPLNRDECERCTCKGGRIHCARVECQSVHCQHPVQGKCCPVCDGCLWYDQEYTNGQVFTHARAAPCKECTCYYGTIECLPKSCPGVRCTHPIEDPDPESCCPICSDCKYQGNLHRDGSSFPSRNDPCQTCHCRSGSVTCQRKQCPSTRCRNPILRPGECCSVCDRDPNSCEFKSQVYSDGETIPVNRHECEKCVCEKGRIRCGFVECPKVHCQHPVKEDCCPNCRGCSWNGKTFQNGQSFPDPRRSQCHQCVCNHGTVTCNHIECPLLKCDFPVKELGDCCPRCKDCLFENQRIRDGDFTASRADPCVRCQCQSGNVMCKRQECAVPPCDNPLQRSGECCPVCDTSRHCKYSGGVLEDGQLVPRKKQDCEVCRCINGRISCSRTECHPLPCTHPIPGQCCPSCEGCLHHGKQYQDQERVDDPLGGPCQECLCNRGNISCGHISCPKTGCSHPATQTGDCCPSCSDCFYEGQFISDGNGVVPSSDPCSECLCESGRVTCKRKECPSITCNHPAPPSSEECCPRCVYCIHKGKTLEQGDQWVDLNDPCSQCVCDGGTVTCSTRACPPATCSHPLQGQCCLECSGCQLAGLELLDGDILLDPNDPCLRCECKSGNVACGPVPCPRVNCAKPIPGECGCPYCPSFCVIQDVRVADGESVTSPADPCEKCTCRKGELDCVKVFCHHLGCARTVTPPGQCCPLCSDCEVRGLVYRDGDTFPNFLNACETCQCNVGEITCEHVPCEKVQCSHPRKDGCCSICDGCSVNGEVYENNEQFSPEPCRQCICQEGEIICKTISCPSLSCPVKKHDDGQCCPECRGCEMHGVVHEVGSIWRPLEDSDCTLCQCFSIMTICSRVECLTPCLDPVIIEGHCCPLCPGSSESVCEYGGNQYKEDEVFSPTGNPCDICQCQNGSLDCYMKKCDIEHICPDGKYIEPPPGQCCGSCSQINTPCSKADIGRVTKPTDDPCFTCECLDENILTCGIGHCPVLDCLPAEQVTVPDSCCPKCAACEIPSSGERLANGDIWKSPLEPCFYCHCDLGQISCEHMTCQPVVCPEGEMLSKRPGECCSQCLEVDVVCNYGNITYQLGEGWRVDECTKCFCDDNTQVSCRTETCPPLKCLVNEDPSLVPGQCCPVCITKPATCTVFGDPHYHTFDGRLVSFQGTCRYVMSADCKSGVFRVESTHNDRGSNGVVSWVDTITLHMNNTSIDLLRGQRVKVNNTDVALPYLDSTIFYIEKSGERIVLYTQIGLKILWDGDSYAELSVPGSFEGALCGICGNFNGFSQDDFTTRTGTIVTSPATFGNSWMVLTNETCADASDIDTCAKAGYRVRKMANTKCAPIKGTLFSECHRVVPPDPYFASCAYDLCACDDVEKCQCDAFSAYAQACSKAGVTINWRSRGLCAIGCIAELGFIFDECGPACPTTCENIHLKRSGSASQCLRPCVPGCQCPAHLLLHQGRCIQEEACPTATYT